jgi:peptidoglycan/xylan/chitin deacetylase (PgdA/CDA1 family)
VIALALAAHVERFARANGIECRLPDAVGVALTFDDGPHREGTPAVLEQLASRGARATFFLVGEQVRRHPELARRIADEGHEVAVHCDRHTLLLRRRARTAEADLGRAFETIASASGAAPSVYRPPYGVFSAAALHEARRRGWRPLLWSRWGRDWSRRASPASIARRATRGLRPGDVVVLHDSDAYSASGSWRRTAAALPSVLDAIAALDVRAVAVTQRT